MGFSAREEATVEDVRRLVSGAQLTIADDRFAAVVDGNSQATLLLHPKNSWPELDLVRQAVEEHGAATSVVALGGGYVLDFAKLFRVARQMDLTTAPGVGGLRVLDPRGPLDSRLTACATTLGPNAESSSVACASDGDRRRLFVSGALFPTKGVVVPDLLAELGTPALRLGCLEIVCRLLGPVLGIGQGASTANTGERIQKAREVVSARDEGRWIDAWKIGAYAHDRTFQEPVSGATNMIWLLATSFSTATGVSKAAALESVAPAYASHCVSEAYFSPGLRSLSSEKAAAVLDLLRSAATEEGTRPTLSTSDRDRMARVFLRDWGFALRNYRGPSSARLRSFYESV